VITLIMSLSGHYRERIDKMPKKTLDDWKPWHAEMEAFASRDTEGFVNDIHALKAHILKLQAVCPKDSAGWPVGTALRVIDNLQKQHNTFTRYLEQLR